ncbi:MAG: hypothetical protein WDM85_17670 [Caulobacteraceae bacterium]
MIIKTDIAPDAGPLEAPFLSALPGRPDRLPASSEAFLKAIAADYRPDELPGVSAADVAARAASFWLFAQAATEPEPAIRIGAAEAADGGLRGDSKALGADLVEIVQPDAPFLVDSVMAELIAAGASILAMFHPIVENVGGRRSTIQVWIEPMGEEAWPHLQQGLRATLADVRLAVDDFDAMTGLIGRAITDLKAAAPQTAAHADRAALAEDLAFLAWLDAGHFVFLGARAYDYPRDAEGGYAAEEPVAVPSSGLGLLRDASRVVLRRGSEPAVLSPADAAGAGQGAAADRRQVEPEVGGAPAGLHGLRRHPPLRPGRQAQRRGALRRPVHRPGL